MGVGLVQELMSAAKFFAEESAETTGRASWMETREVHAWIFSE